MTPEQYIERNIETLKQTLKDGQIFTTSAVQRSCRVGYNQARHTIDEMVVQGLAKKNGYLFEFTAETSKEVA